MILKNLEQSSSLIKFEGKKKFHSAPLHPKQTRYQAALHADKSQSNKLGVFIQGLIRAIGTLFARIFKSRTNNCFGKSCERTGISSGGDGALDRLKNNRAVSGLPDTADRGQSPDFPPNKTTTRGARSK